ncbi:MAG: nucleotide exchange factor GrpE [Planctomycetes bacterium]|nr:nucleotide exchange factor GrpE [Planctomycetota bacterium]
MKQESGDGSQETGERPNPQPAVPGGELKTRSQIVEERLRRMKEEPPAPAATEPPPAAAAPAPPPESDAMQALRDRLAYALADYDNLQKRISRERADLRQGIVVHLARDLLPVLDGFDRALGSVPPGEEGLAEGMRRVQAQLRRAVESHGIQAIEASGASAGEPGGAPFDPALHESVAQEVRAGVEPGRVLEVIERGYRIGDIVLRPAKVRVSAKEV